MLVESDENGDACWWWFCYTRVWTRILLHFESVYIRYSKESVVFGQPTVECFLNNELQLQGGFQATSWMKRGLLRKVQTGRLHRFLVSHFQLAAAFESSPHQIFDFLFKSSVVLSLLSIWCLLNAVIRDPFLIVLICVWLSVHWSFYTFCIYAKILTNEIWT